MTRLLTPPVVRPASRVTTDILRQPAVIRRTSIAKLNARPRRRRINYAKKIQNDPLIWNA